MEKLSDSYRQNIISVAERLRVKENFDVIRRDLSVGGFGVTLFYIDGFIKDAEMLKIIIHSLIKFSHRLFLAFIMS